MWPTDLDNAFFTSPVYAGCKSIFRRGISPPKTEGAEAPGIAINGVCSGSGIKCGNHSTIFLAFSARRRSGEKGRLGISAGCGPLDRKTAIDLQLGQRELLRLSALDLISQTINFYITSSGSVTPTWKLVRVTAPLAGTFASASRKDTNTLIIAFGRPDLSKNNSSATAISNQILTGTLKDALSTIPR